MRAVVETHMQKEKELPALKLKICKGVEDLTIKVISSLVVVLKNKNEKFRSFKQVLNFWTPKMFALITLKSNITKTSLCNTL